MTPAQYLAWLEVDCGYKDARELPDGRWGAVEPLPFSASILAGPIGDFETYDERWGYPGLALARSAFSTWDGVGEPAGWVVYSRLGAVHVERGKP